MAKRKRDVFKEIEELLGEPVPLGGDTVLLIRQDRRSH
jgi:hypothetical protein